MITHSIPRFLLAAVALVILGFSTMEQSKVGGNNGMGIKLWLFVALGMLLLGGIYLIGEMVYLLSKSQYKLALINSAIILLAVTVFLILMKSQ